MAGSFEEYMGQARDAGVPFNDAFNYGVQTYGGTNNGTQFPDIDQWRRFFGIGITPPPPQTPGNGLTPTIPSTPLPPPSNFQPGQPLVPPGEQSVPNLNPFTGQQGWGPSTPDNPDPRDPTGGYGYDLTPWGRGIVPWSAADAGLGYQDIAQGAFPAASMSGPRQFSLQYQPDNSQFGPVFTTPWGGMTPATGFGNFTSFSDPFNSYFASLPGIGQTGLIQGLGLGGSGGFGNQGGPGGWGGAGSFDESGFHNPGGGILQLPEVQVFSPNTPTS